MPIVLEKNQKYLPKAKTSLEPSRSLFRLLAESVFSLLMFTVLLETYFSLTGIGQQEFLQPDPEYGVKHIPNKIVTWRMEGYSSEKINSDGLRDTEHSFQKAPGVYRIALLGDSATEGLQVALKDTYGKVLEKMLNAEELHHAPLIGPLIAHDTSLPNTEELRISSENSTSRRFEVINFGCSSYSTGQQLQQYRKEALKYNPDAIILMYNRGDSFENTIKPDTKLTAVEPRPYFYLDDQNSLRVDKSALQANREKLQPHPFFDFLRIHSRIFGVFSQAHLSLTLNDSRYRKLDAWLRSLRFNSVSLPGFDQGFGQTVHGCKTPTTCAQDPMKVTLALVHTLAAETRSRHQLFVLMMFPNTIGDPEVAQQQKQLKALADQDGFDFIDLLPPFQNTNPEADFIQIHFSPKGHEHVAFMLTDLFLKKLQLTN